MLYTHYLRNSPDDLQAAADTPRNAISGTESGQTDLYLSSGL